MERVRLMNAITLDAARSAAGCSGALVAQALREGRIFHKKVGGAMYTSPAAVAELRRMMAERSALPPLARRKVVA